MTVLQTSDLLEVRTKSLLADYDRDTIVSLYGPILGFGAISLYFAFWSETTHQNIGGICTHESFLMRLQMSSGDFVKFRKTLEAIGLLKTYLEKGEGCNYYKYELASPKTPFEFFNDPLLYGLLIKYLGENEANKIKMFYTNTPTDKIGEEISSTFGEIFHPNFEDSSYQIALETSNKGVKNRRKFQIDSEFSLEKFFVVLKKMSQFNESSFTEEEVTLIIKLATLYGVSEEIVAERVIDRYDSSKEKGLRINSHDLASDFLNEVNFRFLNKKNHKTIKNKITENNDLAIKINLFETVSPKEFLYIKQNGTVPAPCDLWIIYDLSTKYQLTNPVINVLIDYVLAIKNNILSRSLCEKIAASLARSNIKTATDAMNYINENSKMFSYSKYKNVRLEKKYNTDSQSIIDSELEKEKQNETNEENWDELISSFKKS